MRFSVEIPVPNLNGQWAPGVADTLVGAQWPLKATLSELGAVELTARVVAAQIAPDGLTLRLDLETEMLDGDFVLSDISIDGD
ncbi:hypothetical protein [Streptomyces zaomyceticus]|uniref:hypothetical protein n=1 Tax=Streptomyces zaomyceticus TaxID=68286 RepID=UPI0036BB52A5